ADAALKSAKTELEIQETENTSTLEKALITQEKATLDLQKYREGDAPKERRNLEIAIKTAATTHSRSKKKYEDSQKLIESNFIKKTELENDQIEFERSVVQLEGANLDLDMFNTYVYPMTLKDKETALKDAQRSIESASKRAENLLLGKQVAVQRAEKHLKSQTKRLADVIENLEKMVLKAPVPGIVLYGDPKNPWTRENVKIGGEVWGDNTVFTIPDLRVMQVKLGVHEADINKVKENQPVQVTMDTYSGLSLTGKVTRIATIANSSQSGGSQASVKKFDVLITVDGAEKLKLKPGISAKAEIHIADLKRVLHVPLQAVFLEDGDQWVNVSVGAGRHERRKVEVGLSNDNYIEIKGGLEEGEQVLLFNPDIGREKRQPSGSGGGSGDAEGPGEADADNGATEEGNPDQ
ncbi:MAG: HlyD family efflux transporter periplasmic adaptor subunit, partial [Planctomycetes bacterium]|nr:HlyD family efflux transporter periplasmic adaptor subunit [Planctomycetota bacterium]